MIWVIQQWTNGKWDNSRHPDGQPMWYPRKSAAQIALRSLSRGRYRIIQVRD
jgi:hypothetical protein